MDIIVYTGFSKPINSTKRPSGGQTVSVFLKHPTSVVNPTFRITGFNTAWNYVQWGSRYYYVRDIIFMTETQAEYVCEIDVLATYKNEIGASSQYVVRAASAYNGAITDALYPMTAMAFGSMAFCVVAANRGEATTYNMRRAVNCTFANNEKYAFMGCSALRMCGYHSHSYLRNGL